MPSRRSHTKSHHGCTQCKARRVKVRTASITYPGPSRVLEHLANLLVCHVSYADSFKCDETLPECQRCMKRQMKCSFQDDTVQTPKSDLGNSNQNNFSAGDNEQDRRQPDQESSMSTPVFSPGKETVQAVTQPISQRSFTLSDLELIHHYSTKTYITLTSRLTSHIVWRDVMFREALRHSFLLDALMATSALHKASYQPEGSDVQVEYQNRALKHQNAAISGYIAAMSVPTHENSIALVALSLLLPVWSFGSKKIPQGLDSNQIDSSPSTVQERILSLMQLTSGIHAVIKHTGGWLEDLSELMIVPRHEDLPPNPPELRYGFDLIERKIDDAFQKPESETQQAMMSKERYELYKERLCTLRFVARTRTMFEWDAYLFTWPVTLTQEFMDLLRQHDPISMVLFVFWAACFRAMDHLWWAKGWAYRIVSYMLPFFDDSWSELLNWPKEIVGLGHTTGAGWTE